MTTHPPSPAAPGAARPDGPPGRRAVQAEHTRDEILRSARRLFAQNGYAATSLKEIAKAAGVSVQTVYDSVGQKAQLVRRLNDLIDAEANLGPSIAVAMTSTDAGVVAALPARLTRLLVEHCGDIVRASVEAARVDPDLHEVAEEGGRRHRAGNARVAGRLAELGLLRPGLDVAGAAATMATLSDARVAFMLIDDHGLDLDGVERWMAETIARTVLTPGR